MFSIFKKKSPSNLDFSWLEVDMHSHLLPGIDDGAQDMTASMEYIKGLAALGFRKFITTPHIYWELYPNTPEIIKERWGDVKAELDATGIEIELEAAAEYFMDEHFHEELKKKIPLLPLKDNLVLVEFSMVNPPLDLHEVLFEMQMQNYQPVIAHPERYVSLRNKPEFFQELHNNGNLFQLNLLSLTGYYGESVQDLAEQLIKKDLYSYAGTDLHHQRHLDKLQKLPSSDSYNKLKESGILKNHLL